MMGAWLRHPLSANTRNMGVWAHRRWQAGKGSMGAWLRHPLSANTRNMGAWAHRRELTLTVVKTSCDDHTVYWILNRPLVPPLMV